MYYGLGIYRADSYEELLKIRDSGKPFIVEEQVKNDIQLSSLNDSSLNTLRVVTCVDRNNKVNIVAIMLRTGSKGSIIDNLLGGGTCYHVDLETGVIDSCGRDGKGNYYVTHPSSGIVMPGFKIPKIKELKDYSVQLANHLLGARYVGWDIAVTPNGLDVIEGNVCPSSELIQCDGKGLLKKIQSYY